MHMANFPLKNWLAAAALSTALAGMGKVSPKATITVLAGEPGDENSFAQPQKISPRETVLKISGPRFQHKFPGNSLTILRLKQVMTP
jgi:alpha-L-arabinofuranosidase